jgi:hypothetical protein
VSDVAAAVVAETPATPNEPVLSGAEDSVDYSIDATPDEVELDALRAKSRKALDVEAPAKPEPEKPKSEVEAPPADDADDDPELRKQVTDKDGKLDDAEMSKRFAALHRKTKGLAAREAKIRDAELKVQALEAERAGFENERKTWRETRQREPLKALHELGWSWEQLTTYVAQNGNIPPEKLMADMDARHRSEIERIRNETQAETRALREAQQRRLADEFQTTLTTGLKQLHGAPEYARVSKGYTAEEVQQTALEVITNTWQAVRRKHGQDTQAALKEFQSIDLAPATLMRYFESRLEETERRLGHSPGQAGAVKSAKTPAQPITNSVTAERTPKAPSDDGIWTEADAEEARRRSLAVLNGG